MDDFVKVKLTLRLETKFTFYSEKRKVTFLLVNLSDRRTAEDSFGV